MDKPLSEMSLSELYAHNDMMLERIKSQCDDIVASQKATIANLKIAKALIENPQGWAVAG